MRLEKPFQKAVFLRADSMPDRFLFSGVYVYNIQIRIIQGEIIEKHHY